MKLNWAERVLMNNPVRAFIQSRVINWMKAGGELKPGANVLEVGCGRGAGAMRLLKGFDAAAVIAMDLDPRQIERADAFLGPELRRSIHLLVGGTTALPLADSSVDAAFSFGMLHHAVNWRAALDRISAAVRPGGFLFLEEYYPATYANFITKHILYHPPEDRFVGPDLREALAERGFEIIRDRDIRGYSIRAVCRKSAG